MSLSELMGRDKQAPDPSPRHALSNAMGEPVHQVDTVAPRAFDPLADLKTRVQAELFNNFDPKLTSDLAAPKVRRQLDEMLDRLVASEERLLTVDERRSIIDDVADNVLGSGPIQRFLDDPTVTEIMVNAPDQIFVERNGVLEETDASFYSVKHLRGTRCLLSSHQASGSSPSRTQPNYVFASDMWFDSSVATPTPRARVWSRFETWSGMRCGCAPTAL